MEAVSSDVPIQFVNRKMTWLGGVIVGSSFEIESTRRVSNSYGQCQ
jgi:hypothetical protein